MVNINNIYHALKMFRPLRTQVFHSSKGDVIPLEKEEMVYYRALKTLFPDRRYLFLNPDLVIIEKKLPVDPFSIDNLPLRTRFVRFLTNIDDLKNIPLDIPVATSSDDLYELIGQQFPKRKVISLAIGFALNDDLVRIILSYFPPFEFVVSLNNPKIRRIVTPKFLIEKIENDFKVGLDADLTNDSLVKLRQIYMSEFIHSEDITLHEAIEFGKTCPDIIIPRNNSRLAIAFGMILGGCSEIAKENTSHNEYISLIFSGHLHLDDDKTLIKYLQGFLESSVPDGDKDNLVVLYRLARKFLDIYYFTPEIIQRAEKITEEPGAIINRIMLQLNDYPSTDALLYLADLYPDQVDLLSLINRFDFWLSGPRDSINKKWLRPLIERVGGKADSNEQSEGEGNYYIARVMYELKRKDNKPLDNYDSRRVIDNIWQGGFNDVHPRRMRDYNKEGKYYIIVEGDINSKDRKFRKQDKFIYNGDTNQEYTVDLIPIESQIMTIDDEIIPMKIEEYLRED